MAGRCGEDNAFIDILLSHGVNPENAGYAYMLLPSASEDEVACYAADPKVEILRNDANCQAVKYADGTVIATFWEPAEVCGIVASTPCMAIVEGDKITLAGDGNYRIWEQCRRKDVVGIISDIIKMSGRTLSCSSLRWRCISWIWMSLPQLARRAILGILWRVGIK